MSQNLETTYNPKEIEPKLYQKWCGSRQEQETIYHGNASAEYHRKVAHGPCA